MKHHYLLLCLAALAGCNDSIPTVNLGIDNSYCIARMTKLPLRPALTGNNYKWTVNGKCVSTDRNYVFVAAQEGTYHLTLDIIDPETPYSFSFTVNVIHEDVEYSPYIAQVNEYCPAPGEFINKMPPYDNGDTYNDMLRKCTDCISGTNDVLVSLGGYGGYITFSFDHTVINTPGKKDFRIWGNAFYELTDPDAKGGSAEPGIVAVSFDKNCNGLPDDEWYEIAGSEHFNTATLHNYTITYHRPDNNKPPRPSSDGIFDDTEYLAWNDSQGNTGYMPKNIFHNQSYWPQWVSADRLTFTGTLLPPNGVDSDGTGRYYVLYAYPYGYADNHPNDLADLNSFDIADAVDANGNPVDLPGIDFVRVYTGVNQHCGWLGETSTEIARAEDLNLTDRTQ